MFRQVQNYLSSDESKFAAALPTPTALFNRHPMEIVAYMEAYWNKRTTPPSISRSLSTTLPSIASETPSAESERRLPGTRNEYMFGISRRTLETIPMGFLYSGHLIYAYMIENTRVYEIFQRVLHEYRHGEKLGTPSEGTQNWLRITEELFYSDSAPFFISNVSSHIRSDLRASRRNAYQRMFGMDLNHGSADGKPYPYVKAEAANTEFVAIFEEFLREVWVGITYVTASSSSNPTDDSKIANLARRLHDMLQSRRLGGNLSREEFAFVTMMSWFHASLEAAGSPVVASLRAEAVGVENILFKIAQQVGLPAHGLAKNFFDIADPLSLLLIQIETGTYSEAGDVRPLYDKVTFPNGPEPDMRTIINHWTAITGRDVKARKVAAN